MISFIWWLIFIAVIGYLLFQGASLLMTTVVTAIVLLACSYLNHLQTYSAFILWVLWLLMALFNFKELRLQFVTMRALAMYRKVMPTMSRTEKEALEAGTVWWGGELFSGKPNWNKLLKLPKPTLSEEEKAFIDGPVAELCRMINDWDITHKEGKIPDKMWQFIRDQGFFGLIIPKQYGGKEFSAQAHAAVVLKLFSCSVTVASSVAVPNSLGPAELLLYYGTDEQKDYYLPRLANGTEVPCFALTGPDAGSDAGAMPDYGVVCKQEHKGKKVLGVKVSWDKRYITLCPVATVLGLAFKLYDPDHLLGDKDFIGVTCALIPTSHKGVETGRRHFPSGAVFQNGPTHGKDVFIPLDWIIGGPKMAGKGWRMLVECLSVGRSISLPASGNASAKVAAYATGAYARIRRQFNLPIGRFEGIEAELAQIAGMAYQGDAAIKLTLLAIDMGEKPAVPSAILKYHCTEMGRTAGIKAMDVHGGKAVCLGPKNYLALGYQAMPIGITVEGANILTRNMIIFGQGSIRCHPYVLAELEAAKMTDEKQAVKTFDKALFGHVGFALSNVARSIVHGATGGAFARTPKGKMQRYYRQFTRFSSAFALLADSSMLLLGGELKRRERLSARLGDVLSYLYIGSACLKRFADHGRPQDEEAIVNWSCQDLLFKIQTAIVDVLQNFPNKMVSRLLYVAIFPTGANMQKPSDKLDHVLADSLMNPSEFRDRLAEGICIDEKAHNQLAQLQKTLELAIAIEPIEKNVRLAKKAGKIDGHNLQEMVKAAYDKHVISEADYKLWQQADALRHEIIAVDDFPADKWGN